MADLHNLEEALSLITAKAIRTSQGSFVRVEDVKKILEERQTTDEIEKATAPRPKTLEQARAGVKKDPEIMKNFPQVPPIPGKSLAAGPTSSVEGR